MQDLRAELSTMEAVEELIKQANYVNTERRQYGRIPTIQPVVITRLGKKPTQHSGFTRDISLTGIGLLHGVPMEKGDQVSIATRTQDDCVLRIKVEISWCISCGHGWFMSGGVFLE